MKITYNPDVDVLRILLDDSVIDESDEDIEGVIMDYSSNGELIGIEILDASKRVDNPYALNYSIAQTETARS